MAGLKLRYTPMATILRLGLFLFLEKPTHVRSDLQVTYRHKYRKEMEAAHRARK